MPLQYDKLKKKDEDEQEKSSSNSSSTSSGSNYWKNKALFGGNNKNTSTGNSTKSSTSTGNSGGSDYWKNKALSGGPYTPPKKRTQVTAFVSHVDDEREKDPMWRAWQASGLNDIPGMFDGVNNGKYSYVDIRNRIADARQYVTDNVDTFGEYADAILNDFDYYDRYASYLETMRLASPAVQAEEMTSSKLYNKLPERMQNAIASNVSNTLAKKGMAVDVKAHAEGLRAAGVNGFDYAKAMARYAGTGETGADTMTDEQRAAYASASENYLAGISDEQKAATAYMQSAAYAMAQQNRNADNIHSATNPNAPENSRNYWEAKRSHARRQANAAEQYLEDVIAPLEDERQAAMETASPWEKQEELDAAYDEYYRLRAEDEKWNSVAEQAEDQLYMLDAIKYVEEAKNQPDFRQKVLEGYMAYCRDVGYEPQQERYALAEWAKGNLDELPKDVLFAGMEVIPYLHGDDYDKNAAFYYVYATDQNAAQDLLGRKQEDYADKLNSELYEWAGQNTFTRAAAGAANIFFSPAKAVEGAVKMLGGGQDARGNSATKTLNALQSGGAAGLEEKGLFNTGLLSGGIDESVPFFGGMSLGDAYGLGISIGQSLMGRRLFGTMGTIALGLSAVSDAYDHAKETGASDTEAWATGFTQGLWEALSEYFSLDNLVKMDVNAAWWKNALKQAGIEASEEFCSSLATAISDPIIRGEDSDFNREIRRMITEEGMTYDEACKAASLQFARGLFQDAFGGFVSGGFMTAGEYAFNGASSWHQWNNDRRSAETQFYGNMAKDGTTDAMSAFLTDNGKHSKTDSTREIKRTEAAAVKTMSDQFSATATVAEAQEIYDGVTEQYGKSIKKTALRAWAASVSERFGKAKTTEELDAAYNELTGGKKITSKSTGLEKLAAEAYSKAALKLSQKQKGATAESVREAALKPYTASNVTTDTEAAFISEDGTEVHAQVVSMNDKGELVLDDGTVISASKAQVTTKTQAALNAVQVIGGKTGALFFEQYLNFAADNPNIDGADYVAALHEAYLQGMSAGAEGRQVSFSKRTNNLLTEAAYDYAYNLGVDQADTETREQAEAINRQIKAAGKGATGRIGSVTWASNIDMSTKNAKRARTLGKILAQACGVDVRLVKGSGQMEGSYRNGVLTIDIDQLQRRPGETVQAAILRVASHELTHFIQDKNAADYKALKNFCFGHILQAHTQEEIDLQKQNIIDRNADAGHKISAEEALDEMVANACEQLLSGSDILSELYRQNASLGQKVTDWISNFFAKLREGLGSGARIKEAAWMADAIDELQEKWENALRIAAKNQTAINGIEGIKNTATEGGEMQYSIATSLKDDLQSVFDNKFDSESSEVLIGETSDFLVNEIGVKPLPNYMPANKAYSAMATEEKAISDGKPIGEKYHYHGLGVNGLFDLLEKSENPVAAYAAEPTDLDGRFDRLVLVTDKEINGGLGIVVVEVDSTARQGKKQIEANKTITSYDKQSAIVAVQKAFDENRLLYVNKKSGTAFDSGRKGSNSPTTISETVRKNNIQQFWANVNWAKYAKNTKSRVFTSGDTSGTAMADAFIKAGYGQNSAVLPASALDTDEAYLAVAEKYRDGTATEAIDKLQQKWNAALAVAARNNKALGDSATKNTATKGGVQYSFANTTSGMANDKLGIYPDELKTLIESRGDVIVDSYQKLLDIVNEAFDNTTAKKTAYFGIVDYSVLKQIEASIPNVPRSLNGVLFKQNASYSIAVTYDSIRHLVEDKKALTRNDVIAYLDRMADTIIDNDTAYYTEYVDSRGNKLNGIKFDKAFPDGVETSINIVSNRKKTLNMQSLYIDKASYKKKKSAITPLMQNAPANTPVARGSRTSTNNILNTSGNVNTSGRQNSAVLPASALDTDEAYLAVAEKYRDGTATEAETEQLRQAVEQAAKKAMPNTKILDEDGNLLTVYHGTSEQFTEFDMSKGRTNMDINGSFFSPWELDAHGYGENVGKYYLNITKPANESTGYKALHRFQGQNKAGVKAREYLESLGYDGVNNENEEFIAFRSEQIKSADLVTYDDNGEIIPLSERFKSDNKDIRYSAALGESALENSQNEEYDYSELNSALENGIIDRNDYAIIVRTMSNEIRRGAIPNSASGEYIMDTGKRLVFTNGNIRYPTVNTVIEFSSEYESERALAKEWIIDEARDTGRTEESVFLIKGVEGEEFITVRSKQNGDFDDWENRRRKGTNRGGDTGETGNRKSVTLSLNALDVDLSKLTDEDILSSLSSDGKLTKKGKLLMIDIDTQKEFIDIYQKRLNGVNRRLASFPHVKANADEVAELEQRRKQYQNKIAQKQNAIDRLMKNPTMQTILGEERARLEEEYNVGRKMQYDTLKSDYGIIAKGEVPAREVTVPKQIDDNTKVSKLARTALEAEITPDSMVPVIEDNILDGMLSYEPQTNKAQRASAESWISGRTIDRALGEWSEKVSSGRRIKADDVAKGWILYNNLANAANEAQSLAERRMLQRNATEVLCSLQKIATESGQLVQAMRLAKKMSPDMQYYALQKSIENLQKELDDGINKTYSKDGKEIKLEIDETLSQNWLQAMREGDKVSEQAYREALYSSIAKQVPKTLSDRLNAWRYLSMLGNPRTIIRNVVGNVGFMPAKFTKDFIGGTLEKMFVRDQEQRTKTVAPSIFTKNGRELMEYARGDFRNVNDIIKGIGKYSDGKNISNDLKTAINEAKSTFNAPVLKQAQAVTGWLMDNDVFGDGGFLKHHYTSSFARAAHARGYTAAQLESGSISSAQLDSLRAYAIREAQKATYRDANAFSNFVKKMRAKGNSPWARGANLWLDSVLPFKGTPANVLMRSIEYSPIGLVKALTAGTYSVSKGKISATDYVDQISSGLSGSMLWGLGMLLASLGMLKAGSDDDDDREGRQGYSLQIGNKSITLDWLAPAAIPMFMGTSFYEMLHSEKEDISLFDALSDSASRMLAPLLEMSMLSGVQDLLDTMTYGDTDFGQITYAFFVQPFMSYVSQYVPTLLSQIANATEKQQEFTYVGDISGQLSRNFVRSLVRIAEKIPGVNWRQQPYVDNWGRTQDKGNLFARFFNSFINPAYVSDIQVTDIDKEIRRIEKETGIEISPTRRKYTITVNGEKIRLNGEQFTRYQTAYGEQYAMTMAAFITSSSYRKMTDAQRTKAFQDIENYVDAYAKEQVCVGYSVEDNSNVPKIISGCVKYGLTISEAYAIKLFKDAQEGDGSKERVCQYIYQAIGYDKELFENIYFAIYTTSSEKSFETNKPW